MRIACGRGSVILWRHNGPNEGMCSCAQRLQQRRCGVMRRLTPLLLGARRRQAPMRQVYRVTAAGAKSAMHHCLVWFLVVEIEYHLATVCCTAYRL